MIQGADIAQHYPHYKQYSHTVHSANKIIPMEVQHKVGNNLKDWICPNLSVAEIDSFCQTKLRKIVQISSGSVNQLRFEHMECQSTPVYG